MAANIAGGHVRRRAEGEERGASVLESVGLTSLRI